MASLGSRVMRRVKGLVVRFAVALMLMVGRIVQSLGVRRLGLKLMLRMRIRVRRWPLGLTVVIRRSSAISIVVLYGSGR